jgi:hypothetical protein
MSYLYIAGAGYSGSTLLAFLLNAHPQMVSISETEGPVDRETIREYYCSCGALLIECPFFVEIERRINALGSTFSLTDWQTAFQVSQYEILDIVLTRSLRSDFLDHCRDAVAPLWPGYVQSIRTISQRMVHFVQATLALSGKTVFVDAQKDPNRIKFLNAIRPFDLKVVHLVRDIRGAVASRLKNAGINDVAWATRKWCSTNMNADRARRSLPPQHWLRVTYSELCADPQGTVDRIADFVGVARAPILHDFHTKEHHILGNRMRLKISGHINEDESWKERLTEDDLRTIAGIGGATNRYFGHDWP